MPLLLCWANQLPHHSARSYNPTYHHNHHADHTPPQPERERLPYSARYATFHIVHVSHTHTTGRSPLPPHFRHILALQDILCCTHDAHCVRTPALHYRDRDFLSNCLEEKFRYSHLPEKQLHHTSRQSRLCPQGAWRYCNRARVHPWLRRDGDSVKNRLFLLSSS
jgi:hypothetical protein